MLASDVEEEEDFLEEAFELKKKRSQQVAKEDNSFEIIDEALPALLES
jgi:hypothetical protein